MTTMIDFVRQLNQKSTMTDEQWLDRLRHLDSGLSRKSDIPEVVIVSGPEPDLKAPKGLQAHVDAMSKSVIADARQEAATTAAAVNQAAVNQAAVNQAAVNQAAVNQAAAQETPTVPETTTPQESTEPSVSSWQYEIVDSSAFVAAKSTMSVRVDKSHSKKPETSKTIPMEILDRTKPIVPVDDRFVYDEKNKDLKTEQLVNSIVQRFPVVSPATVMFVSIDDGTDCDSVASRVAQCMASRDLGEILLIDGHTRLADLTSYYEKHTHLGLAEIINRNEAFQSMVHRLPDTSLDFLPIGKGGFTHRKMDWSRLSRLTIGLNRKYQFSVISGGRVGDLLTDMWSAYVDGVYLLVDVDSADKNHTREAVAHLRELGSRIIGCIVKQQDED